MASVVAASAPPTTSLAHDYLAQCVSTERAANKQRQAAATDLGNSARAALEWAVLKRWERDYEFGSFRFECDTFHACHKAPEGSIVCFNAALGFYGCRVCRRAHCCRGRWNDCILVLGNDGAYTCAFSGRVVEYDMAAGNFDEEVRIRSLSKKDAVSRGGDTLENMHMNGKVLRDTLAHAKEWHRQTERQKRWRTPDEEEAVDDADDHDTPEEPSEGRARAAKRARIEEDEDVDEDNGELDDDFDAGEEDEIHGYGTEAQPEDYDMLDAEPLDEPVHRGKRSGGDSDDDGARFGDNGGGADDDGGGGFGGGGDGGDRASRYTTTDVYRSGILVSQWSRNMDATLSKPHNLEPLDTTLVPTSFLSSVPLDLNRYHAVEHALCHFDTEYATELSGVAQQFDASGLSTDDEEDASGTLRKSLTESAPSTPPQPSSVLMDTTTAAITRQRAYARALRRVKRGIENDVCSVLRALHGKRIETESDYINFSMRLFHLLLRADPMHMPMHLQKLGFVVVLDLLIKPFVITDGLVQSAKTRKKREYNHLIWNADAVLADWQRVGLLELLFVDEGHRGALSEARYTRVQLECVYKFRKQHQIKRAQFKQWTSETRQVLMRMATVSPTAFHAALFSCPLL